MTSTEAAASAAAAAAAAATTTTTTTTKSTVMKCHDCSAPFTNDQLGSCSSGGETVTQGISSHNSKGDENRNCWWWCRDCMATLCR
ncbi:unnamed protein product [Cercopithifilaria johnstoni]|uniref:Uncharacterized protein n=1 Tax=Cercopithifilaria johnstoni TaxID=2874296 RepID=A0A8J2PWW6_9BILA|nr:unnamed protein product [Cercopithifilaria johnstoni]